MSDDDFVLNNVDVDESSSDDELPTLNLWKTKPKADLDTEDGDELRRTLRRIQKQRVNTDLVQTLIKKGKQDVLVDAFLSNNIGVYTKEKIDLDAEKTKSLDGDDEHFDSGTSHICCGTKVFDVTNFQCLFRPENVTLLSCGYEEHSDASRYEKLLLSKSPFRAVHYLVKVLCMGHHNITNHSAFLLYLLRVASVSKKLLLTDSIRKYIKDFFNDVEDEFRINISVADIFEIFINFGLIVEPHCPSAVLKLTYENLKNKLVHCGGDNSMPFENKHWFSNLDVTIFILDQLLKYCRFSDSDLLQLFLTVLWIAVDENLIYSELRSTLKNYMENILSKFSIAFWNSGEISTAISELDSIDSHSSLHSSVLLEIIKVIPANSEKGKNLKRVIAYKVLCHMLQVGKRCLVSSELMFSNLLFILRQFHHHLCDFNIDLSCPQLDTMISLIDYCVGFDPVQDLEAPISDLSSILIKCRVKLKNEIIKEHFERVAFRLRVFIIRRMVEQSPFMSAAKCYDKVEVSVKEEEMDIDENFEPKRRPLISHNLNMKHGHSSDRDTEVENSDSKLLLCDTTSPRLVSNKTSRFGVIPVVKESAVNDGIHINIPASRRTENTILTSAADPSNDDSQPLQQKEESSEDNRLLPKTEDMCISDSEMEIPVFSKDNDQLKTSSIFTTNLEIGQSVEILNHPKEGAVTEGKLPGENTCISDSEMEIPVPLNDNDQLKTSSISSTSCEIDQSVEILNHPKEGAVTEGKLPGENTCISDSEMEIPVPLNDNDQLKTSSISSTSCEIDQSVEILNHPKEGAVTEGKLPGENTCISDSEMEIPVPLNDNDQLKTSSISSTSCEIDQSAEICCHSKGDVITKGELRDENKFVDCTFISKNHDCSNSISMDGIAIKNLKLETVGENSSLPEVEDMVISDLKNELLQPSENDSQQIKNIIMDKLIQTGHPTSVTSSVPREKDSFCDIRSHTVANWSLNCFYEKVCEPKKEAELLKEKEMDNKLQKENATIFHTEHNYAIVATVDAPRYTTSLFDNELQIGANVTLDCFSEMAHEDSDRIYEPQSANDSTSPSKEVEKIRNYNQSIRNYEHDYSLNFEMDKKFTPFHLFSNEHRASVESNSQEEVNASADQLSVEHVDENRSINVHDPDNSEEEKVLSINAPLITELNITKSTPKDAFEVQHDSTMTYTSFSSNELEQSVKIQDVQQELKLSPAEIVLPQHSCDKCQNQLTDMHCNCAQDPCTVVECVPSAKGATYESNSPQTTEATNILASTTVITVSSQDSTVTFDDQLAHEDIEMVDLISDSENMEEAEILPEKAIMVSEASSLALSNQLPSGNIQHASVISITNETENTDTQLNVPPQLSTAFRSSNTQLTNSSGHELTKASLQSVGNFDSSVIPNALSKSKDLFKPSDIQLVAPSLKSPVLFDSSNVQFVKSTPESQDRFDPPHLQIATPSSKSPVHFDSSNNHSSATKSQPSFDSLHGPLTIKPQLSCESLGGPTSSSKSQDFNSLDSQSTCVTKSSILNSFSVKDYLRYIKTKSSSNRLSLSTNIDTSESQPTATSNFNTNSLSICDTSIEIESLNPVSVQKQAERVDSQQNETAISQIDVFPSRDQQPNIYTDVRSVTFAVEKETTHEGRQENIFSSKELCNKSVNSLAGMASNVPVPVLYRKGASSDGEIEIIAELPHKSSVVVWNDKTCRNIPPSDAIISTGEPTVTSSQSLNTAISHMPTNQASTDLNSSLCNVPSHTSSNTGAFTHELSTINNINISPSRETSHNDDNSRESQNVEDDLDVIISTEITRKSPELITLSDSEEVFIDEDDGDIPVVEYIQRNGIIYID